MVTREEIEEHYGFKKTTFYDILNHSKGLIGVDMSSKKHLYHREQFEQAIKDYKNIKAFNRLGDSYE
jgi:hypothetical protein